MSELVLREFKHNAGVSEVTDGKKASLVDDIVNAKDPNYYRNKAANYKPEPNKRASINYTKDGVVKNPRPRRVINRDKSAKFVLCHICGYAMKVCNEGYYYCEQCDTNEDD